MEHLGVILVVLVAASALLPIVLRTAYGVVRHRNTATVERTGAAVTPMATALQDGLGSMLARVDDAGDPFGVRRLVLADRVALTPATLERLPDREACLGFIWLVRPSQPAGFGTSQQLAALPEWAQDAVVLLDLRRDLRLRGPAALGDQPGFYRHSDDRLVAAMVRTQNADLLDGVRIALRRGGGDTATVERLLEVVDRPSTWSSIVDTPDPA